MIYDRIHQLTSTSGTGPYTLGSTVTGRLSVLDALTAEGVTPAGAQLHLWILGDDDDSDFEEGIYTFDGVDQLARTKIIRSSNSNAAVNWGSTAKNVISFPGGLVLRRLLNAIMAGSLGGTANARTVASSVAMPPLYDGLVVWATAPAKNTGAMTLEGKAVRLGGAALEDGDVPADALLAYRFDAANDCWHLSQPGDAITALFRPARIAADVTLKDAAIEHSLGATVAPSGASWGGGTADIWSRQGSTAAWGNVLPIDGPGVISSFGTAPQPGAERELLVVGALTLQNGSDLVVQGGADYVAAPGDRLRVRAETATKFRVAIDRADGYPVVPTPEAFASALLHVRDEKTAGTAGGSFSSGGWRTRTLNTEVVNQIAGASLGANQITLPAGTYYAEAYAVGFAVVGHCARLQDVTDAETLLLGSTGYANSNGPHNDLSLISGRFTLDDTKIIELQHRCSTTHGSGFGSAANVGVPEIYAEVKIWKVA